MKKSLLLLMFFMAVAVVAACTKKQEPAASKESRVSATKAYEKYFGPAPVTDKGSCFAFVIYFPSAKQPGKAVPFPFFTFDKESMPKVALERLLSGMEVGTYRGGFKKPFPPETRILSVIEREGRVTVDLSSAATGEDGYNAAALTLLQFPGVKDVRILVAGKALVEEPQGDERSVLDPSPPQLLSVTAMRDKGAKDVEEVSAYFDRPVEIKYLQMSGSDGKPFDGDIYHAVFDMAAVLKPRNPGVFSVGTPVKVRWRVVDKVGRQADGEAEFPLEVKEH